MMNYNGVKFRANRVNVAKFYYKNYFCQSLLLQSSERRLFNCKLNCRERENKATIREINSTEIDSFTTTETQDYAS